MYMHDTMIKSRNVIGKFFCLITLLSGILCSCTSHWFYGNLSIKDNRLASKLSMHIYAGRHYGINYNFIVRSDSLYLHRQIETDSLNWADDSFCVYNKDRLAVSEIRHLNDTSVTATWIQLVRDEKTLGWVQEDKLMSHVVPDDPISWFIAVFSGINNLLFLMIIALVSALYGLRYLFKRQTKIVHFNDIKSFYPSLLTLVVATLSTLYGTIQHFVPDKWVHFYFHPSLNLFELKGLLSVFISGVWLMVVIGIAVIDDIRQKLETEEMIYYLLGLLGVCIIDYIVFTLSTIYYLGYILLPLYYIYTFYRYFGVTRGKGK